MQAVLLFPLLWFCRMKVDGQQSTRIPSQRLSRVPSSTPTTSSRTDSGQIMQIMQVPTETSQKGLASTERPFATTPTSPSIFTSLTPLTPTSSTHAPAPAGTLAAVSVTHSSPPSSQSIKAPLTRPPARPTGSSAPTSPKAVVDPLLTSNPLSKTLSISSQPPSIPLDFASMVPTVHPPHTVWGQFRQKFIIPNETARFSTVQLRLMESLFSNYTEAFAPGDRRVATKSEILNMGDIGKEVNSNGSATFANILDYRMSYTSSVTNVTAYPKLFLAFINANLSNVTADLQALGINTSAALPASQLIRPPTIPTTASPTSIATVNITSTIVPSSSPPSLPPTSNVPSTHLPSEPFPETEVPFLPEDKPNWRPGLSVKAISAITIVAGLVALLALVLCYRHARKTIRQNRLKRRQARSTTASNAKDPHKKCHPKLMHHDIEDIEADPALPHKLVECYSLGDDSEAHSTMSFQDEPDPNKDQNPTQYCFSRMEEDLSGFGFEDLMNVAITKARIGESDDFEVSKIKTQGGLSWGCHGNPPIGAEVEASVLCEVNNWLHHNQDSAQEPKHVFLQEILNRIVGSVLYGFLSAEDASRTFHESAALLGTSLAHELPNTTVLFYGMCKSVTASHIIDALIGLGDIETAAVASGSRGFGIIRFRRPKSVDRVMQQYRDGEIVIQDVPVQMRVLTAMREPIV